MPVARRPPLPVPLPLEARAVRRGRAIVVTWRTAFPARRVNFDVTRSRDLNAPRSVQGRGRTRFKLTLRPSRPGTVRRIVIEATDYEGEHSRKVTVPVTR